MCHARLLWSVLSFDKPHSYETYLNRLFLESAGRETEAEHACCRQSQNSLSTVLPRALRSVSLVQM